MSWSPYAASTPSYMKADFQSYGGYGGCGHCGKPTCGNKGGQYGGCGTFLRIAVKDPQKKACILEKRIAHHTKCCEKKCFWNLPKYRQSWT